MQPKSELFSEFSERTERLAHALGLRLTDLPPVIGMSEDMLFGCRKGRYPISQKTWRKLEKAEREAGVFTLQEQLDQRRGDDEGTKELLQGASIEEGLTLIPEEARRLVAQKLFKFQVARTKRELHSFFLNLGGLIEAVHNGMPLLKKMDKKLAHDLNYFAVQVQNEAKAIRPMLEAMLEVTSGIGED